MKSRGKILLIFSVPVLLLVGVVIWAYFYFLSDDPEYVVDYIKEKPEQAALYLSLNGETLIERQADQQMPLASTVKIIVAIEYAHQVVDGKLDPEEKIALGELDKYYLENTDGGAHPKWLEEVREKGLVDDKESVSLHHVVKGMITYSSNANTDYLIDRLELKNINQRLTKLGLKKHQPLYPISSAMLIPDFLQKEHDLSDEELYGRVKELSLEEYRELAIKIHQLLKTEIYPDKAKWFHPTIDIQQIWSDRLPAASAAEYGWLMERMNQRDYFSEKEQQILEDIMEWPMEVHPGNKENFKRLGGKGGSTVFVLTEAIYAEDHKGNKVEFVFLSNQQGLIERLKVTRNFDLFLKELLLNEDFLKRVVEELQ